MAFGALSVEWCPRLDKIVIYFVIASIRQKLFLGKLKYFCRRKKSSRRSIHNGCDMPKKVAVFLLV